MKVHDVMSTDHRCVGPANTLVEAACVMRLFDVGAVPVCDGDCVIGMITERDIVLRGVASGGDLNQITVLETISHGLTPVYEDEEADDVARLLEKCHVGRLPVVDRERHLVGMVSRANLAMPAEA